MSRILGIDYGTKRVGVALSDEAGKFALPLKVLANSGKADVLVAEIAKIAAENGCETVVLGESKNYAGKPNEVYAAAEAVKKALEEEGLRMVYEPEFMSSVQAGRWQGENSKIDASAAAIILQSYLDRQTK